MIPYLAMSGAERAAIIIGAIVVGQVVMWSIILTVLRKTKLRNAAIMDEALEACRRAGERVLCGPAFGGMVRGIATRPATFALTDKSLLLVYKKQSHVLPLADMGPARTQSAYRGNIRLGKQWLVFSHPEGEIGLALKSEDSEQWFTAATGIRHVG